MRAGLAQALIAEYEGVAIAHVILFHFGGKCWYFYGASANEERGSACPITPYNGKRSSGQRRGVIKLYDMWGAPDVFDETDALWGVYQFKRGFRGTLSRHIGAWDFAAHPLLYYTYAQVAPRLLNLM